MAKCAMTALQKDFQCSSSHNDGLCGVIQSASWQAMLCSCLLCCRASHTGYMWHGFPRLAWWLLLSQAALQCTACARFIVKHFKHLISSVEDIHAVGPSMQGYAWEITTPEGGWGLDGVLQGVQHKLDGIANGIDTSEWSPESDRHLPANYSSADMSGWASTFLC